MNNGLIKIYALAVCFSSLLCCAVTLGFFLYNMVRVVAPETTIDPDTMLYYSSNEAFRNSPFYLAGDSPAQFAIGPNGAFVPPAPSANEASSTPKLTDKEIETLRSKQFEAELSSHRVRAKQSIIQQAIILLISSVLFLAHWKLAKNINHEPRT